MNKKMILGFSILLILMASCQSGMSDELVVPTTAAPPSPDIIINNAMDAWNARDASALKILLEFFERVPDRRKDAHPSHDNSSFHTFGGPFEYKMKGNSTLERAGFKMKDLPRHLLRLIGGKVDKKLRNFFRVGKNL